jgi:hypothetical protein
MNKGANSLEWELQKSLYLLDMKRFEEPIQPLNKRESIISQYSNYSSLNYSVILI